MKNILSRSWIPKLLIAFLLSYSSPCFSAPPHALAPLTVPDILDASAIDSKIDPCQDFYRFACGKWLEQTAIPADKSSVMHASTALMDQIDENLNDIILRLKKGDSSLETPSSEHVVHLYDSCMNFDQARTAATAQLNLDIAEVNRIHSLAELARLIAKLQLTGVNAFFGMGSGQDLKVSNSVIGFLDQGGMALPEPSYYFEKDAKATQTRAKYLDHIQKMLQIAGQTAIEAKKNAVTVLAVESDLASKAYSFDDRQNPAKINHPMSRAALAELAPHFDWSVYFEQLNAPESPLNVNEPEFFGHFNQLLVNRPLADLKAYLVWQTIHREAPLVSAKFDAAHFDFWSRYLRGQKKMKPRWKRCVQSIEHELGYALGEVYVKTVDSVSIRAKVASMIDWIKDTFRDDLLTLTDLGDAPQGLSHSQWLDRPTRDEALKKLELLGQKLGAPEKWRDYSLLKTSAGPNGSYLKNDIQVNLFESNRDLKKINHAVDHTEWDMMPWEINAYYDPPKNEFVFPFGILRPPSLDLRASDGANLGAFGGGTIGHELTHGYDNDGRQYDGHGNLKDWWTELTKKRFEEKIKCFVDQASHYKIKAVGLNVDGKKSLTENLADQGGVKLGYSALVLAQSKRPPAALWQKKYTENQQYWIAYAQGWCTKTKPESLRTLIKTNPHPPEEFRVNGVLINRPEFAHDFACKPGAPMAPLDRCSLW